jgi:hypothetical protein
MTPKDIPVGTRVLPRNSIGMKNIFGLTDKEKQKVSADYAIAQAEWLEARSALRNAQTNEETK